MNLRHQKQLLYPEILWKRPVHSYKKSAGSTLMLAGSRGKEGTPLQVLEACHRAGADAVTLGFPNDLKAVYKGIIPDGNALALPDTPSGSLSLKALNEIKEFSEGHDLLVVGPGLSRNAETLQLVWETIFATRRNLVLSSSAVDAIVKGFEVIREKEYDPADFTDRRNLQGIETVLVLETQEAVNILKALGETMTAGEFEKKKMEFLAVLAQKTGWIIVHIGQEIAVTDGMEMAVTASESALNYKNALVGILVAFLSQNPKNVYKAAVTATFVYTLAKNLAWQNREGGQALASDVIKRINRALLEAESTLSW